jgi:hypothetical protein
MAWFNRNPSPAAIQPAVITQFDQCCYTLILNHLNDEHTNAETLWQKKFTASPKICEKNSQNENYRLQAALDKNTANIHCYNEKLKRTRPEAFIYNDVVVWLPQMVVEKELRQNTGALSSLTTNLPVLHNDRFKAQLLNKRPPHYVVMPSSVLQQDEIAFQFGFGIYVAEAHELAQMVLEAVFLDEQDNAYSFTPQVSYQVDSPLADNRIYPEQDNVLLIKPSEHLCANLPYSVWFSDLCSHIQLQRNKDQWKAFASSSGANTIKIDTQTQGREWHFELTDTTLMPVNGKVPRLQLVLKPVGHYATMTTPQIEVVEQPAPVFTPAPQIVVETPAVGQNVNHNQAWGATVIPALHQQQSYRTIIPDTNTQTQPLLILEGLALPRIDNPQNRVNGLKQWTIWFDGLGNIVDGNNLIQRNQLAAVTANHQQGYAYFKPAGQGGFTPLMLESDLYLGNRRALVLPSPLPERFHAVVKLINPINFALQAAVNYTVGRKGENALPDIDLTLLNDASGMDWEAGSAYQGSVLSMLSLSRNHLSFRLENQQLFLTVPAGKQPVYLLNGDLSLKEVLQDTQRDNEAVLNQNEYLLLGSFVLRFLL